MSKSKEKTSNQSADAGLDYRQLAEQMLGSWQDQWRQFADNKTNPFASGYGDLMTTWSNAMTSWTNPMQQPTSGAGTAAGATAGPAATSTPTESANAKPAASTTASNASAAAAPASQPAAAQTVPPAAAAASNARDVLLTELARRVEFLHERVVTLESELEKLRAGK